MCGMGGEAHGVSSLKKGQHWSQESKGALSEWSGEKRCSEVSHVRSLMARTKGRARRQQSIQATSGQRGRKEDKTR